MSAPPIRLHQFPRVWGRNISPFTLKLESWLTLAGIPFEVVDEMNPGRGPKGKIPFIEDGETRIGDSSLIIEHLSQTRGVDLDAALDRHARAEALAVQRLLEEHLYFIGVYGRWIDPQGWDAMRAGLFRSFPPGIRDVAATLVRRKIRRDLMGQGILRHDRDEIYAMGAADLGAVSVVLDDGPFFFQGRPGTLDCIAYGFLSNVLMVPVENELKRAAERLPNLRRFCEAMERALDAARAAPDGDHEPAVI